TEKFPGRIENPPPIEDRNMKPIRSLVVAVLLLCVAAPAVWADHGAIAYSPETGKYGYSYNCGSRAQAERLALRNCPADDAAVKVWVKNGYAALAVNDDGDYGWGWSGTS